MFLYWVMCLKLLEKNYRNDFELDSAHYLCSPAYTWDAVKRFTYVKLKLISDIEEYLPIESMIAGGISVTSKGYVEVNNKFLK